MTSREAAIESWNKITSTAEPASDIKNQFIKDYCDVLSFNFIDSDDDSKKYRPLSLYIADMSSLKIRISGRTLIGLIKIPKDKPLDFISEQCTKFSETIRKGLSKYRNIGGDHFSGKVNFLLIDGDDSEIKGYFNHSLDDIVYLKNTDIFSILESKTPLIILKKIIREQIDLDRISPYQYVGPVSESMFFGRKQELRQICNVITSADQDIKANRSFAIIASRQKGKTSLLQRIYSEVKKIEGPDRVLYIDCLAINNGEDLAKEIVKSYEPKLAYRLEIHDLKYFLKGKAKNRRFILFLDEVDDIIRNDIKEGLKLFKVFRAAYNEGFLRVVMCGYKLLYRSMKDEKITSTYNFLTEIRLLPFEKDEVFKLITEPMDAMGLKFFSDSEKQIVDYLFEQTAGDPSFVQFYCSRIVDLIDRKKYSDISFNLIKEIEDSQDFKKYLEDTFMVSTSNIEKFILYTSLKLDKSEFSFPGLHKKIRDIGLNINQNRLDTELRDLEISGLIVKESDYKIRFSYPALPKVLNQLYIDYRLSELLPDLRSKFENEHTT